MAKYGVRWIQTPFEGYTTSKSKRTRIHIPQPIDKPIYVTSRSNINQEYLKKSPWYYVLHHRGIHRPLIGEDPLEMRAVSEESVRGTLPERIVYKWLVSQLRLVEGIDFDFQSSQSGGRMELGGIVVDFIFPIMKLGIQVQGVTHKQYRRKMKDDEQNSILAEFGYWIEELWEDDIYNESIFEQKIRRIFNIASNTGYSVGGEAYKEMDSDREPFVPDWETIYQQTLSIYDTLGALVI